MYDAALKLGVAVVKAACGIWLGDPIVNSAATTVVDLVQARVTDRREQRRLERRFGEIEEAVADRILEQMEHEFRGLADNEREAAVLAVADSFERAGLTDRVLFEQDLDPLYLERYVRGRSPGAARDLGAAGRALYDRLLPEACAYVMATLTTLPRFQAGAFTELLRREGLILRRLEEVLDRLPRRVEGGDEDGEAAAEAAFVTAYRRKAAERWDVLELFGTDAGTRRYPLTLAYLSLRVSRERWDPDESGFLHDPDEDRVERALGTCARVFLRGPAGSGKTTLLRWIGVRASRGDFPEEMDSWNGLVPFLVPLRQYVGRDLPEPADFVAHTGRHLADRAPDGWVGRVLAQGRGVVLVDGVDELPPDRRESARRWLRELVADFPDSRYVVTTRPGAAAGSWLDGEGFVGAELQPLGEQDVRAFVHHWHEAVRSETVDAGERERLTRYEGELGRKLTGQRHLLALAATPLLCALLCALYRDRHTALPRDRMEVYEAALSMLLKDRDLQRGIDHGVDLSRSEMVLLLQELAKWLVINGASDAPVDTARRRTGRALATMHRVEYPPERVFDHLLVRSGLLQTPAVDRVSFLHRTFEEYLAAKALVEDDSLPLLVRNAHDDQWHETVVMAAGHAAPAQREELVRGLLTRSDRERRNRDRLLLVAFACLETSPRLSEELREEIHTRVRGLLPPRNATHVRALSLVGEAALPLLAAAPPANAREARWTIEAAGAIGGRGSAALIDRALDNPAHQVFLAAQRVWWADQDDELAEVFLPRAAARYPEYYIPVPAERIDLASRHMPGAPRLSVEGRTGDTLDGLALVPQVHRVHLRNREGHAWHGIDLDPVGGLEGLTGFEVYANAYAASVAPLLRTPLERLALSHADRTEDLEALREFPRLASVEFTGSLPRLRLGALLAPTVERLAYMSLGTEDLSSLEDIPGRLTRLRVTVCRNLRSLKGIESQAGTLVQFSHRASHPAEVLDLAPLTALPRLSRLRLAPHTAWGNIDHITRLTGLRLLFLEMFRDGRSHDLSWVREIPGLEILCLDHPGTLDLTSLAGARDLVVHVRQGRRVIGADLLGEGSAVVRGWPEEMSPW
ncbi:hypothetical protein SUDANB121_00642 [Nocardiopsis dassonvillei]|uniref:NACHT domain-containing protein n=1 Tax=Nocardiopsis dassonvillei TaxID=2014 RepID=UPI003F577849